MCGGNVSDVELKWQACVYLRVLIVIRLFLINDFVDETVLELFIGDYNSNESKQSS